MSSLTYEAKCPQCNHDSLAYDWEYNGESLAVCCVCGYAEETKLIATDNRFEIDNDGWEIIAANDRYKQIRKNFKGFGVIRYANINGGSTNYPLASQLTSEGRARILKNFESQEIDKSRCYLTAWNEEEKRIVVLFGTLPTEETG